MRGPFLLVAACGFFVPPALVPERAAIPSSGLVPVAVPVVPERSALAPRAWQRPSFPAGVPLAGTLPGPRREAPRGVAAGAAFALGLALGARGVATALAVSAQPSRPSGQESGRSRRTPDDNARMFVDRGDGEDAPASESPEQDPRGVVAISNLEDFIALTHDGEDKELKVVQFIAKNCRGCKAMKPKFNALVKKHGKNVRFFEVNYADGRKIYDMEGIKKTPTVLYYQGKVGRVGGSSFGPPLSNGAVLSKEFTLVNGAKADVGALSPSALVPALRYQALVGMMRAFVTARERLAEEAYSRGVTLGESTGALAKARKEAADAAAAARAEKEPERAAAAAALLAWVDVGKTGSLDARDIKRVMRALTADSPTSVSSEDTGLPEDAEELEAKLADAFDLLGTDGCIRVEEFTNLMLLHSAHERKNLVPEAEAKAAFALLAGSGAVRKAAEAAKTLAGMCELLPLGDAAEESETTVTAIEKMLAAFDYEEKGHLHFESFARVVMRSMPSPW